ncbi:carotenoid biosynthesis protein [bacterium]|nr:carotenoid biosynthesis protein [bacterium]
MNTTQFLPFELLMIVLVSLCLRHAWKEGTQNVLRLFAGIFFGVMLEWATIKQLDNYEYGTFFLMIDNIPLGIGMGWGVILYSAMLFSDHCQIKEWARPVLDGLVALNIDLAMDAIAIRLGMWDWGDGLSYEYFGVPFENFWSWFWVIFSFSAAFRILNRLPEKISRYLAPLGSIPIGVFGVLASNRIISSYIPSDYDYLAISLLIVCSLGLILSQKPKLKTAQMDSLVMWVPLGFHLYFIIVGIITRVIFTSWIIALISAAMFSASLYLHFPLVQSLWKKAPVSERDHDQANIHTLRN